MNISVEVLNFQSFDDFDCWKKTEESKTNSNFVLKCAPQVRQKVKVWYFYCSRSGIYRGQGSCLRQLKSQGSRKIGSQCTAHMKAIMDRESGNIHVTYCSTHTGHSIQLSHLQLSDNLRQNVAAKLQQGVDMGRILDDIRDNCLSKSLSRDHLISKKDIHNIKYQYNIGGIMKHKNDQISVAAIVNELEKEEDNPILLFKKQGEQDSLNRLLERDFALGIQTIFQVQMMKKFNKDIICVDDTHGTNSYDFYLTTLLVMDEFGEGIPVGWLISNRQDEVVLQTFFERI